VLDGFWWNFHRDSGAFPCTTPGELGHQIAHTRLTTPNTQPSVPPGRRIGPYTTFRHQRQCARRKAAAPYKRNCCQVEWSLIVHHGSLCCRDRCRWRLVNFLTVVIVSSNSSSSRRLGRVIRATGRRLRWSRRRRRRWWRASVDDSLPLRGWTAAGSTAARPTVGAAARPAAVAAAAAAAAAPVPAAAAPALRYATTSCYHPPPVYNNARFYWFTVAIPAVILRYTRHVYNEATNRQSPADRDDGGVGG